jgi:hypothetical protein
MLKLQGQRSQPQQYAWNSSRDVGNTYQDAAGQLQSMGNGGQPTDFDAPVANVDSVQQATSGRRVMTSNNSFARGIPPTSIPGQAMNRAFQNGVPPTKEAMPTSGERGFGTPAPVGDRIRSTTQLWQDTLNQWKLDGGYPRGAG